MVRETSAQPHTGEAVPWAVPFANSKTQTPATWRTMIPLNSVWHKPNTEHCYHRTQMLMSMTIRGNITKSCGKGRAQCLKYMVYKSDHCSPTGWNFQDLFFVYSLLHFPHHTKKCSRMACHNIPTTKGNAPRTLRVQAPQTYPPGPALPHTHTHYKAHIRQRVAC